MSAMTEAEQLAKRCARLTGTLEYILAQANPDGAYKGNPALALSVIRANAKAALDDGFQATVAAAKAAINDETRMR